MHIAHLPPPRAPAARHCARPQMAAQTAVLPTCSKRVHAYHLPRLVRSFSKEEGKAASAAASCGTCSQQVRVCIYSIDSNSHSYSHYHHDVWVCVAQLCQIEDPTLPSSQQLIWPCQECLRQRSANACAGTHHVHTANTADTTYPPPVWSRHIGWPPAGCIGVAAECMSSIASLPPELPAKSVHAWGQIRHCAHRYNAAELTTGADQWHAVV